MDYLFTCSKCGGHEYMGPIKFDADNSVAVCSNCFKGNRCSNAFLKSLQKKGFFEFIDV